MARRAEGEVWADVRREEREVRVLVFQVRSEERRVGKECSW